MKIDQNYAQLSSMKRINSAADDAAGMAIAEKMKSLEKGFDQATQNTQDAINLGNTAEGALGGINEQLNRMRELAVQASNGLLTDEDRGMIQLEIDELKEGIGSLVKDTEFNGTKLLDGSIENLNIASNPNGTGAKMNIANTGLAELGIENFDVTGDFNLADLDNAITQVSEARSEVGAQTNRLESTVRANEVARENTLSAQSRIEDLDAAEGITSLRQNQVIDQYKIAIQQKQMQQQGNTLNLLL